MSSLFFEDIVVGAAFDVGSFTLTREAIIAFAEAFDPQPFHLDDARAASSIYGRLIASGWHTASACHRLVVAWMGEGSGSMGSPGVDELRWVAPVGAGDRITLRIQVVEVTPSRTKPDRGLVRLRYEATNDRGQTVMTMIAIGLMARRASGRA